MPQIRLQVTVKAGARKRSVEKVGENAFRIHTTAAPEKGKANRDVLELLADHLGVARTLLEIEKGATSSKKTITLRR